MKIVGIDPGKTGGLALIENRQISQLEVMPEDSYFLIPLLERWAPHIIYLEKAQSMPGNAGARMFNYGQYYGEIIGILKCLKIPFVLVRPQTWTKIMHKNQRGDDPKIKSRNAALTLFPNMNFLISERCRKPHEGLVDAALIAEYGAIEEYNKGKQVIYQGDLPC
jgi:hypothetical protein